MSLINVRMNRIKCLRLLRYNVIWQFCVRRERNKKPVARRRLHIFHHSVCILCDQIIMELQQVVNIADRITALPQETSSSDTLSAYFYKCRAPTTTLFQILSSLLVVQQTLTFNIPLYGKSTVSCYSVEVQCHVKTLNISCNNIKVKLRKKCITL